MSWKKIFSTVLMIAVALAPVLAGKKAMPVAGRKKTPDLKRRRGL
jgi:hypothetical protein